LRIRHIVWATRGSEFIAGGGTIAVDMLQCVSEAHEKEGERAHGGDGPAKCRPCKPPREHSNHRPSNAQPSLACLGERGGGIKAGYCEQYYVR
jgi:hypothetical protein